MLKLGVLTYTREYSNLGTVMQSFCTLQAVKKAYPGAKVELIDYSTCKPVMRPYLTQVTLQSLKNDCVRFSKYRSFFRNQVAFSNERLVSPDVRKSIEFIRRQNYDGIFVGADTLLELKNAPPDELTAYWLDDTVKCSKFMVAASSHNVVFDALSAPQKEKMQRTVEGFKLLGVRDHPTFRLLSNFVGKDDDRLRIIPDPTFTYRIDYSHIERYMQQRAQALRKPVVCLHLLRNTGWGADLADRFRKDGYLVASLRPAHYADLLFTDLSPCEQMGLYRHFELVITHRFHDSIFSLKNLTPVIFFPEHATDVTRYHESKTVTLFRTFGLEKICYLGEREQVGSQHIHQIYQDAISHFTVNRESISTTLENQAREYEEFLEKSKRYLL